MGLAKYAEDNYEIMMDRLSTRMMFVRSDETNYYENLKNSLKKVGKAQFSPEYWTLPDVTLK